ncbi:MAG: zinc-dependent peptidase [Flavisolibacter sp.]|nr:zinc-dependent peptidase [Flavisolibacter sp.]MBD0374829.1 zinc-dependent peptidase [Flavisolibacter sp.]
MVVTLLQVGFVLLLILTIILFVFKQRLPPLAPVPEHYYDLLHDYVPFYNNLDEEGQKNFRRKLQQFLSAVKITGVNADIEDLDRVLIAAGAVIPVYHIRDWEYINLREVLVYPGNFNSDFDQQGADRTIAGMVGTGALQNVMIISKWELRQGFINSTSNRNAAIHEFVHLIDKMDGTLDGVPEIILERKYIPQWQQLMQQTIEQIRKGESDINPYAATSPVECFAVLSEYYFEHPDLFKANHPELHTLLTRIFVKG